MGAALLLLAPPGMASRAGRIWWCCITLGLVRVPTPSARAARRVLMGWLARRSGRVPLPPAQAGGASCPRARGGSARTNNCAGTRQPNYTTISVLRNFSFYPGRIVPREIAQNVGTDFVYIRRRAVAVRASVRAPPSRPGARRAPGRGGSSRSSERVERLASERAVLARSRPYTGRVVYRDAYICAVLRRSVCPRGGRAGLGYHGISHAAL